MPAGTRAQLTRVLKKTSNRAIVVRTAEPCLRIEVAKDTSPIAVDALKAFLKKHARDLSHRFVTQQGGTTGIRIFQEENSSAAACSSGSSGRRATRYRGTYAEGTGDDDDNDAQRPIITLPATASKAVVSRRMSTLLAFTPPRPMKHQRLAEEEWVQNEPRVYELYWSMGSGKTIGTLNMLSSMKPSPPANVLIVCSNTMIGHWVQEIRKTPQEAGETRFEIVGYTEFRRMVNTEPERFVARRYDAVVVDEAHNYRNLTPAMLEDVRALRQAKRLILLTGTPIQNDISEVEGFLYLLRLSGDETLAGAERTLRESQAVFYYDPSVHGSAYTQSAYPDVRIVTERVPMDAVQTLEYLMSQKRNTCLGPVTVSTSRCNSYNALTRAISNTLNSHTISPKFERVLKNIAATSKYRGPHVVYSHYRPKGVEAIEAAVRKRAHLRTAVLNGSTESKERDRLIRLFNSGGIDVFFITDAAREGIDLQGTGTMHLLEPHDNVYSESQTRARVARHNSHAAKDAAERNVTIVKYVSTFPSVRAGDKKRLDAHLQSEYRLDTSDFNIVDEVKFLIAEAGSTVDEQYEKNNIAKEKEIRPWVEMVKRVGDRSKRLHHETATATGAAKKTKKAAKTTTTTKKKTAKTAAAKRKRAATTATAKTAAPKKKAKN